MVRDGDDADVFSENPVHHRVGGFLQREYPRLVSSTYPNIREFGEQCQRMFKLVCEFVRSGESEFFEVPINRCFEIALRLLRKANPHERF